MFSATLTNRPLLRALANRPFRLLWSGQSCSRIGDFLYEIALAWWVLEQTGSATAMATVLICAFAPMVLFSLVGGVVVDRYPRLQIMLVSDLVRGGIVSLIGVLALLGHLQLWHIYLASLLFGLVEALFHPAYRATIPAVVPATALPSANALSSFSVQAGRVVGPALGTGIVALGGTGTAFLLNGLTFFLAAAFLMPLAPLRMADTVAINQESPGATSIWADLRTGVTVVRGLPWLWLTILLFAISNVTLSSPYSVTLPFLVKEELQATVGTLGLLYASFPLGYLLGGVWLGRQSQIRRRGWLVYGGLVVAGLMLALFGLRLPLIVIALAALINGVAMELGDLAWTNLLQERVPREFLGRVASLDALGSFALLPLGYGLAGWATEYFGADMVLLFGGGITALLAALVLITLPSIRHLD
ncbi:MAG: MFS transporter [Caldilineaceae bacterium]